MSASYWQSELEQFEQDAQLFEPTNLQQRMEVLNALEQLFRFGSTRFGVRSGFRPLLQRASELQAQIEDANAELFNDVRAQIQQGQLAKDDLRRVLEKFTEYRPNLRDFAHYGGGLDPLINGIFDTSIAPEPSLDAMRERVRLEMTPISVILELVDRVSFTAADTFVDIGAGQGQICLLVHLLTQAHAIGVEIDPAYVERAESMVRSIRGETDRIRFQQGDARVAEYTDGTIFFMYTPFVGRVFDAVMERLRQSIFSVASPTSLEVPKMVRPLICTYGDITLDVAKLPWLHAQRTADVHPFRLCIFECSDTPAVSGDSFNNYDE